MNKVLTFKENSGRERSLAPLRAALLGAVAFSAVAGAAAAQTAAPAAAPANDQTTIGEIVVTARHRSESLQTVPIAVSVVSGALTQSKNLNDIADISSQVPSVDFRTGASNKDRTIFIRGAGTISTSPGVEPSVSTVVDGVVLARSGEATFDLLNLDHIEVLEGPQGTLFGKNASAGVVNIVTKNPPSTFGGYIDGSYYEGDEYRLSAAVGGPINQDLRVLLSGFTGYYEGNVKNLYYNEDVNGYRHSGARLKAIATPTSNLTVTFGADYTHSVDSVPTGVVASTGQVAYCPPYHVTPTVAPFTCSANVFTNNTHLASLLAAQGIHAGLDNRTVDDDTNSNVYDNNGGLSLQVDYDLGGGYRLTSITAWRDWRNTQYQDYDQVSGGGNSTYGLPDVMDTGHVAYTQTSQELRIASPKGQLIDYVAGLFYLSGVDHEIYQRSVLASATTATGYGVNHYGSMDDNYAVFGEADVNFTKKFRLIAGYREVWDALNFYTSRVTNLAGGAASSTGVAANFAAGGNETKAGWAGRVGLQYDITSDIHSYVTVSRGYKGPAYNVFFNMAKANTPPLNPETSTDYELGLKTQLFDHRVQADLSAYLTDFENYQANSSQVINGALVTNLVNAGSVTTRGFEAAITAKPVAGLTYYADAAYDDAHVVDFPCPAGSGITCNINGEPLPFAPRWKLHVEQDYRRPIADAIDVDVDTDYNWQSKVQYQLSQTPDTIQPAYGIWNASIGLIGTNYGGWSARVLVKNILDQHYSSYLSHGDLAGLMRWVPRDDDRYYGINLHKDF